MKAIFPLRWICSISATVKGQLERIRVSGDQPMDDVNLLDGRFDGIRAGHCGRNINGPELSANASGAGGGGCP